ncbi:MAG: hypothetical protein IH978_10340 [Nitrospinae bacterium]|nr:hypothetical protein [Nitrospinota bacterium]
MKKHALSLSEGSQRRSLPAVALAQAGRHFVVLTYYEYAPCAKVPAVLLDGPF